MYIAIFAVSLVFICIIELGFYILIEVLRMRRNRRIRSGIIELVLFGLLNLL